MPEKTELKLFPSFGQAGRKGGPVLGKMKAGKAEYHRLPRFTGTGQMQPLLSRISHDLMQVKISCLLKVIQRLLRHAVLGCEQGVTGEAQG